MKLPSIVCLGCAATVLGCGEPCPDGWDFDDDALVCSPPAEVTASAEAALGTGIYGYALRCVAQGDEVGGCDCEGGELAGEGPLRFTTSEDLRGDAVETFVHADDTFRAELRPGVRYSLADAGTDNAPRDRQGRKRLELVLHPGEVLFLQVYVTLRCQ